MRTIICSAILAVAVGTGCSKSDVDQTRDRVEKSVEARARRTRETIDQNMPAVKHQLAETRDEFVAGAKAQFARLDRRLDELGASADESTKATAATLRARRAELQAKLDAVNDQPQGKWDEAKQSVRDAIDKFAQDVDAAIK